MIRFESNETPSSRGVAGAAKIVSAAITLPVSEGEPQAQDAFSLDLGLPQDDAEAGGGRARRGKAKKSRNFGS